MSNCSVSTADSIKLATVVGCDAEDNFALVFYSVWMRSNTKIS